MLGGGEVLGEPLGAGELREMPASGPDIDFDTGAIFVFVVILATLVSPACEGGLTEGFEAGDPHLWTGPELRNVLRTTACLPALLVRHRQNTATPAVPPTPSVA